MSRTGTSNLTGAVLGIAGVLGLLAGIGMLLGDGEDQPDTTRPDAEHVVTLDAHHGRMELGPDVDEYGNPVKVLHLHGGGDAYYTVTVNGVASVLDWEDSVVDEVGVWRYELLVPVGTTIRFQAAQGGGEFLMCSIRQDGLTLAMDWVEGVGVCEVEHVVMGVVWP